MRNADRLLRVIYKDADLEQMMALVGTYRGGLIGYRLCDKDDRFMTSTARLYTKAYPEHYSAEEAQNMLRVYFDHAKKFSGKQEFTSAYHLFFYCAEQLFRIKNKAILVQFDQLLEWDGFSNKVDANIMVAAYTALHGELLPEKTGAVVAHDNEVLNQILCRGAADNHMHLKASGYSAEMSWAALVTSSFEESERLRSFIKESGMIYDNFAKNEITALLLLKKIKFIRLLLEEYLEIEREKQKPHPSNTRSRSLSESEIITALIAPTDTVFWNGKYAAWISNRLYCLETKYLKRKDVGKYFFIERQFLADLFRCFSARSTSAFIQYLFEIYLTALCQIRFFFVQDNLGMGFDKFKRKEESKESLLSLEMPSARRLIQDEEIYRAVFDRCYRSEIVRYTEFRIAPKKDYRSLKEILRKIEASNEIIYQETYLGKIPKIEYGVIIHYIKEQKEPDLKNGRYRWEQFRDRLREQSSKLINYLERDYKLSKKIVGIDAANYEMECRPEVFAPFFRHHRTVIGERRKFGFTFHVGEAFDALASGLRAIDEVIEFMDFRRGDRLGHALALGIRISEYRRGKQNRFAVPLQNHLDNLAWMYDIISAQKKSEYGEILRYLVSEFNSQARKLYQGVVFAKDMQISIENYVDAWILRSDDPLIYLSDDYLSRLEKNYYDNLFDNSFMFSRHLSRHKQAFENMVVRKLHLLYLLNNRLFENGKELNYLEPREEYWEALEIAQQCLRNKIYRRELAIETNPSSNRKISHVSKFVQLPFLTFNSYHLFGAEAHGDDLAISVNTDDCAIFQSDLSNEYSLVVAALQKEGFRNQEIYDYVDYLRKMSLLQTFVTNEDCLN